ncbi:MAG TPA: hypothetical protein VK116_04655 [Planctomycetota bacterium]|nr:hypothetical protein [Planctomycetota bacterium]
MLESLSDHPAPETEALEARSASRSAPGSDAPSRPALSRSETDVPAENALTRFEETGEEFVDLPPGTYLREWKVGRFHVGWSAANLTGALVLAAAWAAGGAAAMGAGTDVDWSVLARLGEIVVPLSARLCLIVVIFQLLVGDRRASARAALPAVLFSVLALTLETVRACVDLLAFASP